MCGGGGRGRGAGGVEFFGRKFEIFLFSNCFCFNCNEEIFSIKKIDINCTS